MGKIEVFRQENFPVTAWSGGTTTELYLYPPGASYQQRNFSWRLSMATVADEKSVFTALPGVKRTLMLLTGTIALKHEGQHQTSLQPFDQDTFLGEWQTTSYGKATDFNVMTQNGYQGQVKHLGLTSQETYTWEKAAAHTTLIYAFQGSIACTLGREKITLQQGDLACISKTNAAVLELVAPGIDSHLIVTTIYKA